MRKTGSGIAASVGTIIGAIVGLSSGVATAAPAFKWTGSATGAAVHFDTVSEDGCLLTSGDLVLSNTPALGPQGIVLGSVSDVCNLDENGEPTVLSFFFGGAAVTYSQTALASATASGSIATSTFFGSGPAVDFNVAWSGTGKVSPTNSHWVSTVGGITLQFSSQRQRNASASGTLTLDGETTTLSAGQLFTETAGELVILNK